MLYLYSIGMDSDKNFESQVEFEFMICEPSRVEYFELRVESSCELSSIIDEV